MSELRPVCVPCGKEMSCVQNEVIVWNPCEPGDRYPGKIDFVVYGDEYHCDLCGNEIVTGFGRILHAGNFSQETLWKIIETAPESIKITRC